MPNQTIDRKKTIFTQDKAYFQSQSSNNIKGTNIKDILFFNDL